MVGESDGRSDRQQLPDEVAAYVRELIFSGTVRPGEYLRLEPIADAVGVSNTPVREGLLRLRSEGFVRLVPRRGFAVERFGPEDVHDLFWAQAKLAGELAARAAKRITPEQLTALEETHERYEKSIALDDEEGVAKFGHSFHRQINLAADSHRLALLLASIVQHLPNKFYGSIERASATSGHGHPAILDAIRTRNGRLARRLIEEHIQERSEHLVELLREQGLWDEARID